MKGVIMVCLSQLVQEKFGTEKWQEILRRSGMDTHKRFIATEDVADGDAMGMLQNTCQVLGITLEQAAEAFGDYWVNTYAPKVYGIYYKDAQSAKDFLLKMDDVHVKATKTLQDARPPRFEYEWADDRTLIMTYKSHRGLIDICMGLVKGVGKHFNEDLKVTKLSDDKIKVVFPA